MTLAECISLARRQRRDSKETFFGTIDAGKEARRVARNKAQKPPATRKVADKRRKPTKHSKPLREEY